MSSPIIIPVPIISVLPVPLYGQLTPEWCWAASGQMTMKYLGFSITQCAEANELFNLNNCCDSNTPKACVQPGTPQWNHYGFTYKRTTKGTALTFDQLKGQIDNDQPVCYAWRWKKGGGHLMVAVGYFEIQSNQMVVVNNPLPVGKGDHTVIPYSQYLSGPNYDHGSDQYDIVNTNSASASASSKASKSNMNIQAWWEVTTHIMDAMNTAPETSLSSVLEAAGQGNHSNGPKIGKAIPVRTINQQAYDSNVTNADLIEPVSGAVFPIYNSEGMLESSVRLSLKNGTWAFHSLGSLNTTSGILAAQEQENLGEDSFFLDLSERNRMYLGAQEGEALKLVELYPQRSATGEFNVMQSLAGQDGHAHLREVIAAPFDGGLLNE